MQNNAIRIRLDKKNKFGSTNKNYKKTWCTT